MRTRVTHVCAGCNGPFEVEPWKAKIGSGVYCSQACRLDAQGYARQIKAALPGTVSQIAERARLQPRLVSDAVQREIKRDKFHVANFVDLGNGRGPGVRRFAPVIALGPSPVPEMPKTMRLAVQYHIKKIIRAALPAKRTDIEGKTGISKTTVWRLIEMLRKEDDCHIGGWARAVMGEPTPVFWPGPGKDKPCNIKPFTHAEKGRRYVRKKKRDGSWEDVKAKGRAYYWGRRVVKRGGDGMVNALFGRQPAGAPSQPGAKDDVHGSS